MNTKALWSVAVLGTVAAFFSACGDGDSTKIKICNAKQSTCLTDTGGQVCSADGTLNLPFQCGEGQRCCDPAVKDANCGEDVTKTSCVGACTPGDTQCGSKGVSLRCSDDGRSWVPTDCPVGTGCDDNKENDDTYGTCVNSDDPEDVVVVCTGGDTACADGNTAKTCEPDGTNWVYTACAKNEVCDDGACVLDPAKGCVPHSGTCEDKTHLKMCNDAGDAYDETIECPEDTTCEDGACQGPVCPIGAIRCDDVRVGANFVNALATGTYQPQSVYACNKDGTGWEISTCPSSEICIYDNISRNTVDTYLQALLSVSTGYGTYPVLTVPSSSRASCEAPQCASPFVLRNIFGGVTAGTAGSFTCGDALDPEEDPLGSYSLCEGLPPYNNLYWANYACTAPEQCVYQGSPGTVEDGFITGPTCSATCVPGAQACTSPRNGQVGAVTTAGEATVTCGDEGTWDYATVEPCENDGRELWCGPNLQGTADNFNIGTCMEPACAAWFQAFDTFVLPEDVGACGTDGKFYPCKPDGSFGDAQDCAQCNVAGSNVLPSASTAPETFAGYDPGQCVTCAEDAQQCLFVNGTTPYYRMCKDGTWSTKACSSALCWEYQDPENARDSVVCGGECAPFTATCGGPDGKQIANCNKDGVLSDFNPCPEGACHTDNLGSDPFGGSAVCEKECIPGTFQCPSTSQAVACTSKGRYDVLNPTTCDVSSPQKPESCYPKLGCAECDPGTFSGQPSLRCALDDDGIPVVPAAVEICNGDGHWDDSIECPGSGTSCVAGACFSVEPPPGEGGNGGQSNGTSGQGGNN